MIKIVVLFWTSAKSWLVRHKRIKIDSSPQVRLVSQLFPMSTIAFLCIFKEKKMRVLSREWREDLNVR